MTPRPTPQETRSTHWLPAVFSDPESWPDNPATNERNAARLLLDDKDDEGWHAWDELRTQGELLIHLNGYRETTEDPGEDHQMDGYEPGQAYFVGTGERRSVLVSLRLEELPALSPTSAPVGEVTEDDARRLVSSLEENQHAYIKWDELYADEDDDYTRCVIIDGKWTIGALQDALAAALRQSPPPITEEHKS